VVAATLRRRGGAEGLARLGLVNALRLRTKLISWLALAALLVVVFTPTLARTLSQAQVGQDHWVEVCTQHGLKRVALQGVDAVDAAADAAVEVAAKAAADAEVTAHAAELQAMGNLEYCPECSLASHALAPPPTHTPLMLTRGADYLAPLFLHAPHTLFAWRGPRPRAPPLTA